MTAPTKTRPARPARPARGPARDARAPVDPRVRERWVAARRAEGRRRLRILIVVTSAVLLGVAAWVVVASPVLDVDRVKVSGSTRLTATEILAASRIGTGDPMVWLDGGAAERRIAALVWIKSARVEREWPGTVGISVTEREPAAWVDTGAGPALVDGTGRVLAGVSTAPTDLPHIVAPTRVPPVGATIGPVAGARVAGDLRGYARLGTKTITVTPRGVVLVLANGVEVRMGSPTRTMTKVAAALAVLDAVGVPVAYVDVSAPSNPVAGPSL